MMIDICVNLLNRTGNGGLMEKKRLDPALWIFILYSVFFIILYRISSVIVGAVILGLYLSMIIMVPARLLTRVRFIKQRAAVIISSVFIFALLVFMIFRIFPIIVNEASNLFSTLTAETISVESLVTGLPPFIQKLINSGDLADILNEPGNRIVSTFSTFGMDLLNNIISRIPGALSAIVIFIIAATYLSALVPIVRKNLWRFFPASTRDKSVKFVADYYRSIQSFISGQLIIAAAVGLIVGVGMTIAGIPYAVFLGFLAFVTNFIPYFGVIITAVPAIFLGLSNYGLMGFVKVGIVLLLANQIEAWVLSPKIQGDRMELNWFVILVGILLFGGLFGIVGVLFAVPIMVYIKSFWIAYVQDAFSRI